MRLVRICAIAVLTSLVAGSASAATPGQALLRPGLAIGELRLGMTTAQRRSPS